MASDGEARNAVLHLMKRFDLIQAQHLGLAYVLAKRDSEEYARLLEAADQAITTVIQPLADSDVKRAKSTRRWMTQMQIGVRQCSRCLTRDRLS